MAFFRKHACILVMVMSITLSSLAQQNRFVYLQTDNRQPFYVKLDKVVYSSSATGYLIIPKLIDKNYELTIGFPKNEFPEQLVNLAVDGKDAGYVLKNFGDKGWGLFNLQTMAVVMASGKSAGQTTTNANSNTADEFSRVLADVVNSPNITRPRTAPEGKKEKPALPDSKASNGITKLSDSKNQQGHTLVYLDGLDTVEVFIAAVRQSDLSEKREEKKVVKEEIVPTEKKPDEKVETQPQPDFIGEVTAPPTNCKKLASENDFLKLRKKMASRTTDFDMISDAMKSFKTRCYSTEQLRNLSVLFLSNQGKYSFFDASYNYVSDPQLFVSLRQMLTDEYFQQRFDAMIRK